LKRWEVLFDVSQIKKDIIELENKTVTPNFWDSMEESQKILQNIKILKDKLNTFNDIKSRWEDLNILVELGIMEEDLSVLGEIKEGYNTLIKDLEKFRLETLLDGPYDNNNAILTLHPGAGGTEAQDWAQMLLRMYTRWGERRGYSVKTLDYLEGDEAGIKSVTILLEGINAYGYAKCEKGIHRLVRISPFDASGRRHTSFASLDVMPEIDDDTDIEVNSDDLRIDTYRSGGAGGQHVNKTDSAVRITHIPTGIVVQCQNERSQRQNKETAMKMLKAKLAEIKEREQKEKIEDIKGVQKEIAWGSQIRSYVFHPYNMVKDHRTNFEIGNVNAVMDGAIDDFINEYLKARNLGKLQV
jgi:peptide chain release factor 2